MNKLAAILLGACLMSCRMGSASATPPTDIPPILLDPAHGAVMPASESTRLTWEWSRPLEAGEAYRVRVWQMGGASPGLWFDQTTSSLEIRIPPGRTFHWSVSVVRLGSEGEALAYLTSESIATFTTVEVESAPDSPAPPAMEIEVPDGFQISVFAEGGQITTLTVIVFGPDDRLYTLTLGGDIYVLDDSGSDHEAASARRVFDGGAAGMLHAVGMAFYQGMLYVSDSGRISTLADRNSDGIYDTASAIVEGLVSLEYILHSNNGIAFGPDGKLYVGVGATTDHGPLQKPMEAAILRMNPDGSDLEVFATGFRNPYDLTFSPAGDLFAGDNNPDRFDDTLRYLPAEELNHVRSGLDYGFPQTFGSLAFGDGSEPPITEFFPSVVTTGLVYYAAELFPPPYRDGIFVAQFGTDAEQSTSRIHTGHAVVFVTLTPAPGGTFRGDWEIFAIPADPEANWRPIDVTVGPDGALYIADFATGAIYRAIYTGE